MLKRIERTAIRASLIKKCNLGVIFSNQESQIVTNRITDLDLTIKKEIENQVCKRMEVIDSIWEKSNCTNYINVGCGVDMRVWRIQLPSSSHVIDVDKYRVIDTKISTLKLNGYNPYSNFTDSTVSYLPLKIGIQELQNSYFNKYNLHQSSNIWCMEGLMEYLDSGSRINLLKFISRVPQESCKVVFNSISPSIFNEFPFDDRRQRIYFGGWTKDLWTLEETLRAIKIHNFIPINVHQTTDHSVVVEAVLNRK